MRTTILLLVVLITVATATAQLDGREGAYPGVRPETVFAPDIVAAHPGGKVVVWARIDAKGNVINVTAFGPYKSCDGSDDPAADKAQAIAIRSAYLTIFKPATINGVPSVGNFVMTYDIPKPEEPKPTPQPTAETSVDKTKSPVTNGRAIALPKPKYPPLARVLHLSGSASIGLVIDEQGTVVGISPGSGHPLLLEASADAACQAKFTPTILSGIPVKVSGMITYNFIP